MASGKSVRKAIRSFSTSNLFVGHVSIWKANQLNIRNISAYASFALTPKTAQSQTWKRTDTHSHTYTQHIQPTLPTLQNYVCKEFESNGHTIWPCNRKGQKQKIVSRHIESWCYDRAPTRIIIFGETHPWANRVRHRPKGMILEDGMESYVMVDLNHIHLEWKRIKTMS